MRLRRLRFRQFLAVLGMFVAVCPGCGRDDPQGLSYRAKAEFDAGRPAEAEAALARLARIRRLTVSERLLSSRLASDRGRIEEALATLEGPDVPSKGLDGGLIASRRGELEIERNRFRAAEAELKRALNLSSRLVDARRRLVWLYVQQDRSSDIAAQSRRWPRQLTWSSWIWSCGRLLAMSLSTSPTLLMCWREWLKRTPAIGRRDLHSRSATGGSAGLTRPIRRWTRCPRPARRLGPRGLGLPWTGATVARAEALLSADSGGEVHAVSAQLRGRLALDRGDAATAAHHFRVAASGGPGGPRLAVRAKSGVAAERSGRGRAPLCRACARPRPPRMARPNARAPDRRNDPSTLQAIASACLALGRRDEARGWFRLALRFAPNDAGLRKALSQIDSAPERPAIPN